MYVAMAFGKINTLEIWIMYGEKKSMIRLFLPSHKASIKPLKKNQPNIYSPEEKMKDSKKYSTHSRSKVNAKIM